MYDNLETKLRALESLGVTEDKYVSIIFPLVESSLPPEILKVWERDREKTPKGKSDLNSILDFLKNEVLSEERIILARSSFCYDKIKKPLKTNISDIPTCSDLYSGDKHRYKPTFKTFEDLCLFCNKGHLTDKCFKANTLSYEDKKNLVMKRGACLICLRKGHISKFCKARVKCLICNRRHLMVMCQQIPSQVKDDKEAELPDIKSNTSVLTSQATRLVEGNSEVLLQTLLIRVRFGTRERVVRAIIDTGSEKTYLTDDIITFLKCENVGNLKLIHKLFGGVKTKEKLHRKYKVNLSSVDDMYNCDVYCLSESVICTDVKTIPKGPWLTELERNDIQVTDIKDNISRAGNEMKLLIGSDIAGKLYTGNIKCLRSGPVAMQTHLGWVLMGKVPGNKAPIENSSFARVSLFLNEKSAENFWKLDVIGISDPAETKTKAEIHKETMQYFKQTLKVDSNGRYEVALPWVLDSSRLPSNRELAEKRLTSMRKKLLDSSKIEIYQEVFDTWLEDQIIEEMPDAKVSKEHYLPHRPVFKESSETTKVRPVFDASAHGKGSLSLNEMP